MDPREFRFVSGWRYGRCVQCRRVFVWRRSRLLLRDARCPDDGASLGTTTHYAEPKRPWRWLTAADKTLAASEIAAVSS